MKKLAIVFVCALAVVASCSKKTTAPTASSSTSKTAREQPAPQPQPADATLALFQQHCGKCHGPTGIEGRAPKLWNMHHNKAEIVDIIKNGEGRMPALGGDMSNAEAELLADYVLTLKKP